MFVADLKALVLAMSVFVDALETLSLGEIAQRILWLGVPGDPKY